MIKIEIFRFDFEVLVQEPGLKLFPVVRGILKGTRRRACGHPR